MELVWKQLLRVMERMAEQAEGLTALAGRMREAIVREQIRTLGTLVIDQEREAAGFQEMEREREALTQTLARDLGLPAEHPSLTELLPRVPASWSNAYRLAAERLRRQVLQVKQANEVNGKLLRQSREFLGWLVNSLVTPTGAAPVYDADGRRTQKSFYHFINQAM